MKAAVLEFCRQNKYILPFIILFVTSLFMHAAGHRVVFYVLAPFMGWILYEGRHELKALIQTKSFVLLSAYLGYFGLTFFWSEHRDPESFFKILRDVTGIMLFSLTLAFVIPKISLPRLPLYFAGLCVGFAAVSALVFYGVGQQPLSGRLIGLGRYENSIHFAFLLSYAVLALVCLGLEGKSKEIALRFILIVLALLFVALSQTRSAYVCLAACIVLLTVLGHVRYALILCTLGVVCAAATYFIWGGSNGILQRLDSYRFEIWSQAWESIKAKPLLGSGIETEPKFSQDVIFSDGGWKSTHNVYIGHLFTGGIVGLLIFGAMVANMGVTAVSNWWRERKQGHVQYVTVFSNLMLCFALVSGKFLFTHYIENVHIHWLVFWAVYSMLWAMEVKSKSIQYA